MKFREFPKEINGFKRPMTTVQIADSDHNYVPYFRGKDMGYVTADDLAKGKLQVRKVEQVKPDDGTRKIAVPSDRVWE